MYLNTQSGLAPALDAIGQSVAADSAFRARQSAYADAGILPQGSAPPGLFGSALDRLGMGSAPGHLSAALGLGGAQPQPQGQPQAPGPQATSSPSVGGDPMAVRAQLPNVPPQTAAGDPAPSPSPMAGFQSLIDKAQTAYGIPAGYLPRLAAIESKFKPDAVSPTGAKGLFQFTSGTASQYGLADPSDVPSSVDAAGRLTRDNAAALTKALGRAPSPGELYLAHQQGAAGAAALLKNPQLPAGQVLASIGADPKNVTVNGGDPRMPAGAFAAKWTSRFGSGGAPAAPMTSGAPSGQPPAAASAPSPQFPNAPAALSGITSAPIQALLRNPATEQIGLKLWESAATGKNYDFHMGPDGTVVRENKQTGQADVIFRAPVKQEFHEMNGRALAFDPQSSTARDVTPAGLPQGYRWASPDERKAAGVQDGAPLYIGPDGKPGTLNGGVNVVNNMSTNPILAGLGKQFTDKRAEANSAAQSLQTIQVVQSQLKGGIIAGAGANQVLALQKIGVALGLPGVDANRITNTETFSAAVKPLVLSLVKNLGSGSGITDADVRFVNQAVGGDTTLEPATLARILDITSRSAQAKVDQYNSLADEMIKAPGGEAYKHILPMMHVRTRITEAPPGTAPQPSVAQPQQSAPQQAGPPVRVGSPDEAMRLPRGTRFIDPNGQMRVRP